MLPSYIRYVLCPLCLIPPLATADHPSIRFGTQGAGPITTIPAQTMPAGTLAMGVDVEYINTERFSDAEIVALTADHVHAHSVDSILTSSLGISYGLSDDLTLSLRLPHVHRDNVRSGVHAHGSHGTVSNTAEDLGDSSGMGDALALGKYRFLNTADGQAALLFGVEMPTGQTDATHQGMKLEAEHQPGSGSWDWLLGLAVGTRAGPLALDANVLYVLATEGTQDTELGDRFQHNLGLAYRIGGEVHDHGSTEHVHRAWDLVLELNGEWSDKKQVDGVTDRDSGGYQLLLAPGLRYASGEGWSAHFSVGVPVVSDPGRGHTDTDYRITAGIATAF